MKKIKILLSYGDSADNYLDVLEKMGAEGVAQYLPPVDTTYDGLILCGGNDVNPARYGEEMDGATDIDFARDEAEIALIKAFLEAGKPIMGICRGHQLINVFFGGSLYQDMPETSLHRGENHADVVHTVNALPDSILGELYGETFAVNSTHHQAVKALGNGLRATATWNGQYVEAIEHTQYPIFGVQWHPERMCCKHEREDTVCGADLFKRFIELCEKHRN